MPATILKETKTVWQFSHNGKSVYGFKNREETVSRWRKDESDKARKDLCSCGEFCSDSARKLADRLDEIESSEPEIVEQISYDVFRIPYSHTDHDSLEGVLLELRSHTIEKIVKNVPPPSHPHLCEHYYYQVANVLAHSMDKIIEETSYTIVEV
jgi:hypothetical protein